MEQNKDMQQTQTDRIGKMSVELSCMKKRCEMLSDLADVGIWEYDIASNTQYQYKKLSGRFSDDIEPIPDFRKTLVGWGLIFSDDMPVFNDFCDKLERGEPHICCDLRSYDDDYKSRWLRYEGETVLDENGKPVRVVGRTLDVTKEHRHETEKGFSAEKDDITGLPRKVEGQKLCDELLRKKTTGRKAFFIILDIDDFYKINDRWGHLYGDLVLETFANIISGCLSQQDMVYRLGGDSFAVLKFCDDIKETEKFYSDVSENFRYFPFPKGGSFSISAGAAEYTDNDAVDLLFIKAAAALCVAKGSEEKGSITLYSDDMETEEITEKAEDRIFGDTEEVHSVRFMNSSEKRIYDFAFDMFNKCAEPDEAINYIFPEIGKYFSIDNISVYEKDMNDKVVLTHCWLGDGKRQSRTGLEKAFADKWHVLAEYYAEHNSFVAADRGDLLLRCPIFDGEDLVGFISYEVYGINRSWNDSEVNALCSLSKMLSVYLLKFRSKVKYEDVSFYTGAMLDNQQLVCYAIDPMSHIITYISPYAMNTFPNIKIGEKCYKCIMGEKSPCKDCPISYSDDQWDRTETEVYKSKYERWLRYIVTKIYPEENRENYLVCVNDITSFIERVNSKDALTHLPTFETFTSEAGKAIHEDRSYAAAVVSISGFRAINEKNGIGIGNTILTEFAGKIRMSLGKKEMACRWGGGKFILLMENNFGIDAVVRRIDTMLNACCADIFSLTGLNVTFNAGLCCIKDDDKQLIANIDKANAARKSAASYYSDVSKVLVYDEAAEAKFNDIKHIESIMHSSLENGEFKAFYQPKVRLAGGNIGGAEALVRWIRPDGEMISPGRFVPVFEDNGFVTEMDFGIYRQVFADLRRWIDEGKRVPAISINVSRRHFAGDDFPRRLEELRKSYNVPHKYVELEITESMFSNNLNHVIKTVNILRDYGFSISVDDFGAGYSNLNLITKLPVDVLKIDGGFFINHSLGEKDKAVISTIITLAHSLNLYVVSEGIENKQQVDFLKEAGCDSIQGFYFYKPMPSKDFGDLLESKGS